jgi:hypothetical protein
LTDACANITVMLRLRTHDAVLCFCCLLLVMTPLRAQQSLITTDRKVKLYVYTPPAYSPSKKFPVLVFLHGQQRLPETGLSAYPDAVPPVLIAKKQWDKSLPFIVVSPIAVGEGTPIAWQTSEIGHILEVVQRHYHVDRERIYLTGVDQGANACWTYASIYPEKVAAVVPVLASQLPSKHCDLGTIPSWSFQDRSSTLAKSNRIATALASANTCGRKYKSHVTWVQFSKTLNAASIYSNRESHDIYGWMLAFTTRRLENAAPYVNTLNSIHVSASKKFVYLPSEYIDSDGHVSKVHWKQLSGERLPASGVSSSYLKVQPLKAGSFTFQLSVTDNRGAAATDKVTLYVHPEKMPLVSSLKLLDGRTNAELTDLTDGLIVNRTEFGVSDFNIRATTHPSVIALRFSINMDHVSGRSERKSRFLLKSSGASWRPGNGTCIVCAIPYVKVNGVSEPQPALCSRIIFTSSTNDGEAEVLPRLSIRAIDDVLVSNSLSGNQWTHNGEDIPGATASIFRPLLSGDYYVRQVGRSESEISNVVTVARQQQGVARKDVEVHPGDRYLQIRAESLPARSYFKILKEGKVILEGAMNDDNRIPLTTAMPKGNYTLILNGRRTTDGITFQIH